MKKIIKRLASNISNATLIAVLALGIATVLASTDWTGWLANMTVSDGDTMTATSWNNMVSAVSENHDDVVTAQATANTATTNAATAQNTADTNTTNLAQISNPNILINSDFSVWQRGEAITGLANNKYGADRFRLSTSNGVTADMSKQSGNIARVEAEASGGYMLLSQYVEKYESYAGKTVTFSGRARASKDFNIYIYDGVDYAASTVVTGDESWQEFSITGTLDSSATKLLFYTGFGFSTNLANAGDWFEIDWLKAEQGSVATPYTVPDPANELARCQRYYYKMNKDGIGYYRFAQLVGYNTTDAAGIITFPVEMRTATPTLYYSALSDFWANYPATNTPTYLGIDYGGTSSDSANLIVQTDAGAIQAYVSYQLIASYTTDAYIAFDAEMY